MYKGSYSGFAEQREKGTHGESHEFRASGIRLFEFRV